MPSKSKKRANGEYAVYKNKANGNYRGQVTVGRDENGKLIRKSATGKTQLEVIDKLREIENKYRTGLYLDKNKITLYDLGKLILDKDKEKNKIAEVTYIRNMETLKRLSAIYNIPIQELNDITLENFINGQKCYADTTIAKTYAFLNRILNEAIRRKIITENPLKDVEKPISDQERKKVRALTEEEQKKLFDVLTTEDVLYSREMILSMLTGMRMGEVIALKVSDVNFRFNTVTINRTMTRGEHGKAVLGTKTKTKAGGRTLQMSSDVAYLLRDAIGDKGNDELIFTRKGKLISTPVVYSQFRRVLDKYEILDTSIPGVVDLHSLRHTFGTRCIEAGVNIKTLQDFMGHKDIQTTLNVYADVFDKLKSEQTEKASEHMKSLGITFDTKSEAQKKQA